MNVDTLIELLHEMAELVDRPEGCVGGGAILLMAASELERRRWIPPLDYRPDIRQPDPGTSH